MKTFVQFQLECLESIDRNSINEGLIDRFIPKSKSKGGYTGQLQRVGQQVLNKAGSQVQNVGGQVQRVGQQVTNKVGNYANQAQRVGQQVTNKVGSEISKVKSSIAPAPKRTSKNDGSSIDSSNMSGSDKIRGSIGAAREAIPAIASGALGINRTDRNISPEMEKEIKSARSRALARNSKDIDYKDYSDTPAGFAAQKTMGRIGDKDWKRDNKGKITGLRQAYDTDKSPRQLAGELVNAVKTKNLSQISYKPAELALSLSQRRGITKHDVDFNNKPSNNKNDSASLSKKVYSPNQIKAYSTATAPIRNVRNALQTPAPTQSQKTGMYGRYAPPSSQQNIPKPSNIPTNPTPTPAERPKSKFAGARDAAIEKAKQIKGSPVVGEKPAAPAQRPTAAPTAPAQRPTAAPTAPAQRPAAAPIAPVRPAASAAPKPAASSANPMDTWARSNPKLVARLKPQSATIA